MADADAPDLLALGTACHVLECDVAGDFLPFQCVGCEKAFCAAHRSFAAHQCTSAAAARAAGRTVVPCPVCASGVELPPGMSTKDEAGVSGVVDAHMRSAVRAKREADRGCARALG